MKKILICSSTGNPRFLSKLKSTHDLLPEATIDFMSLSFVSDNDGHDILPFTQNRFLINHPNVKLFLFKKIYQLWMIIKMRKRIRDFYDCIMISALTPKYIFIYDVIRKHAKTIVLTPWGSEILRANKTSLFFLKKMYKQSDYIMTVNHSRFDAILKSKLKVDDSLYLSMPGASKLIDMHISNIVSKDDAKGDFCLNGKYVITCAYNGYRTQNHLVIIEELSKITETLPTTTHLIFPMTYGLTDDYKLEVETKLRDSGFEFTIITDFMSMEKMFLLQRATDIFIHIQKTDASSASVKEFIMAGATVFNGLWLSYPEIELHGTPYVIVDSYDDLSKKIEEYLKEGGNLPISEETYEDIKKFSYTSYRENYERALKDWIS